MKVCHGVEEIAGQGYYSVYGLNLIGINSKELLWYNTKFTYDISGEFSKCYGINKRKSRIFVTCVNLIRLFKDALKFDCFHFHFAQSLWPYNLDLWLLKKLKKRLFFEFHGSELRGVYNDVKYKYYNPVNPNKKKLMKRIDRCLKYADGVILHDHELIPHLPSYYKGKVFIVPLRIEPSRFEINTKHDNLTKPIIVHAPSKRSTKGTEEILKGLEPVKTEIELILVENRTQEEAKKIYEQADIIIDQIAIGTYGVFCIEAMALGKPVLSYISDEMRASFPIDLPIISINPDNISEKVRYLLDHPEERKRLGEKGIEYVKQNHDCKKIAEKLMTIYETQ